MAELTFQFPTLAAALVFLQRESPASPEDAWARLGRIQLMQSTHGSAVALRFAQGALDNAGGARAAQCGGRPQESGAQSEPWKPAISMQVFFRHIRLEASNRTEHGRRFLVVPEDLAQQRMSDLLEWLSEVESCSVWVREVRRTGVDGTSTVFELNTEGDAPIPTPAGLPGAPQVLVAIEESVFVPAGLECPLLPAYRFLFPPAGDGLLHAWLVGRKGRPSYIEFSTVGSGSIPMARVVVLPAEGSHAPPATGAGSRVTLPLRLRPINAKRRLRRAAQVMYVVESRGGELGAALLRLFDHTEAGIEQFTYFNRVASSGPNSLVEHFLLTESRIADDDMWPELRRFDLPRPLAEVGLPLFLPADADFTPDLEGVITGLDADDPFLGSLRLMVGLDGAPVGRVAMIEPSPGGGPWRITTLERGRPLESLISVVMEDWHREPIRRLLDIERVDLTNDRRRYEEQWLAVGGRESAELADSARGLAMSLTESVGLVARQLTDLEARVRDLREASVTGQELVSAAPRQFTAFINGVVALVNSVTAPRREWLMAAEARREAMQNLAAAGMALQQSVQEEVEAATANVRQASRELATAGDRMRQARATLDRSLSELDPQVAAAQAAAEQAAVAIQGRRERVLVTQAEVASRERALRDRSGEADHLQQAVESKEREVAQAVQALETRRSNLQARMAAAQRGEAAARTEEERLRQIATVELPSAIRRQEQADQELARWRTKRLDSRLQEIQAELQVSEQECSRLKDQEDRLGRLSMELARLQPEAERLRHSIAELRKKGLDASVQAATTEVAELSEDVLLLEAMAGSLQTAKHALDRAAGSLQKVQRTRGIEDLGKKIDELAGQARSLEIECRRASDKKLPSDLDTRLRDIEQITRELRRESADARGRWFGRWFGGSRS